MTIFEKSFKRLDTKKPPARRLTVFVIRQMGIFDEMCSTAYAS